MLFFLLILIRCIVSGKAFNLSDEFAVNNLLEYIDNIREDKIICFNFTVFI